MLREALTVCKSLEGEGAVTGEAQLLHDTLKGQVGGWACMHLHYVYLH